MTSTSLIRSRDYLSGQRRAIIARSVAGSLAGAVPVPFLDDWATALVLGGGYRRIAAAHHIDLDDTALKTLVHGTSPPPSIVNLAASGIMLRVAGRAARRMLVALATIDRARSAARTFVTMTLFDHYCARLHTGLAIDAGTALALRDEIGRAIDQTPGALAFHPFRRGAMAAARATLRAPLELADLATRGAVRRLLARRSSVTDGQAVDALDQAVETALASKTGFLSRTVAAVEVQLSAEANPFLDGALDAFDRRWRARVAASVR
ncbi:MAG TPA: hypothetical protein VHT91_33345 [Kofleriaceae bacterium]|jgi:hypothetical protein|nr:hypothetical protein [Kofleriaceae bacterium]